MPQALQQLAKAALCLPCPSKSQDLQCSCPLGHAGLPGHFTYLPATPACSLLALTSSLAHPSLLQVLHCGHMELLVTWQD